MEFGLQINGDAPISSDPREQFRLNLAQVRAAKEAGFSYILMGQHFLYRDFRWFQPIPMLARLAAEAEGVWFGSSVIQVPLHHPVVLAEELATLDVATNGRLIFGAGLGYRPDEFEAIGIPIKQRVSRFEEALAIIKLLWTQPEVTYEGRYWKLNKVSAHLRPVQKPHPPIWIGAQKDVGVVRAARLGDAMPITPSIEPATLRRHVALFREERAKAGKPMPKLPLRRNIVVAKNRAQALETYQRWAQAAMLTYARSGHLVLTEKNVTQSFGKVVEGSVILGSPEECVRQLTALATEFPVDPIIFRASWPGVSEKEVVATIELLGKEIVAPLRKL